MRIIPTPALSQRANAKKILPRNAPNIITAVPIKRGVVIPALSPKIHNSAALYPFSTDRAVKIPVQNIIVSGLEAVSINPLIKLDTTPADSASGISPAEMLFIAPRTIE